MAHSRNKRENCDARSEATAAFSARAVPTDFDSALSQLNMLDAPVGTSTQNLDVLNTPEGEEKSDFDSHGERAEAVAPTPTTNSDSALTQFKADAFDHVTQPGADVDGTDQYSYHEGTSSGSTVEKSENVIEADPPAEPIDNESPLSLLSELCAAGTVSSPSVNAASDGSRYRKINFHLRDETSEAAAVDATAADYQSALLQIIDSAANDPRELRRVVYELARTNLRTETGLGGFAPNPVDITSLEAAIARVEINLLRRERSDGGLRFDTGPQHLNDGLPKFLDLRSRLVSSDADAASTVQLGSEKPQASLVRRPAWPTYEQLLRSEETGSPSVGLTTPPETRAPVEIVYPERDRADAVRARRRVWLWFIVWPLIQLIGLAGFCLALYIALAGRIDLKETQVRRAIVADTQQPPFAETVRTSGLPLPSAYGVYAISNGTLQELQPLPIRAPDPRVQLSAEINMPGSSVLPDGKVVFVLFRRELLNSAPQKIAVRVVARVASSLTFSSGKAAVVKPASSWHIRGNSYDFQVSPLNENREMVVVRPDDPDFALPSGRYALVFGGLAYDFTVDGPITAPAQCLESFEAVNGPVFTECRPK
jgi:hypothetical protein